MEPEIILNIVLILLVAWLFGDLFRRAGMPRLLGELLAGLILGPPLLGWIQSREGMTVLADLGVFFLMFYAGMEMDPHKLLEHFWLALAAAVTGFIFPFAAGFGVAHLFGATMFQSLFIAIGLSVTSLAVGARVLQDMEIHRSKVGHIIIGAAIIDDILALVAFSLLAGMAKAGQIEPTVVILLFLKVIAFFGGTILVGHFLMPKLIRRLKDEEAKGYTFALLTALIMGFLAEKAGLHLIVGAFLAGQFVREEVVEPALHQKLHNQFYNAIHGFLGPIFFASLSFHISLNLTAKDWEFLGVIILVAMLGKVAGCGLPLLILRNWREAIVIGVGMNGRGEVLLVVANAVLSLSFVMTQSGVIKESLLTQSQFTILILVAFITTLMTPILLRVIVPPLCAHYDKDFCKLWRHSSG